jgi:hypothetical protein
MDRAWRLPGARWVFTRENSEGRSAGGAGQIELVVNLGTAKAPDLSCRPCAGAGQRGHRIGGSHAPTHQERGARRPAEEADAVRSTVDIIADRQRRRRGANSASADKWSRRTRLRGRDLPRRSRAATIDATSPAQAIRNFAEIQRASRRDVEVETFRCRARPPPSRSAVWLLCPGRALPDGRLRPHVDRHRTRRWAGHITACTAK